MMCIVRFSMGIGNHDYGSTLLIQLGQQVHGPDAVFGIKIAGKPIGKY